MAVSNKFKAFQISVFLLVFALCTVLLYVIYSSKLPIGNELDLNVLFKAGMISIITIIVGGFVSYFLSKRSNS